MYTDTHALLALTVTGWCYKERLTPRIVCAVAATFPDYAMLMQCAIWWMNGQVIDGSVSWSSFTNDYTAITHSFFVIALACQSGQSICHRWFKAFVVGWLSHPIIDVLTHGKTEVLYLWPSHYFLGKIFGVIDYRLEGLARTRWEIALDFSLAAVVLWQTWCWFKAWRKRHLPVLVASVLWEVRLALKPPPQIRRY